MTHPASHASGRRRLAPFVVLALLAATPLGAGQSDDVDSTALEWWGSTEVGEGFHLRVPVTVENTRDHAVTNGLVLAEIDIADRLIQAGWVSQASGGADRLRSFEFDRDSVRVVAMTNLDPMADGTIQGRLGVHSTEFPRGDLRRHEVPSTHFAGSLTVSGGPLFDERTNPLVTVMWRVPGLLDSDEKRHYVVYFDSVTNVDHGPADYRGVPGGALHERAFWSGPGVDLLGLVQPDVSRAGTVTVIGLHPETTVDVFLANTGGSFARQGNAATHTNPFTIGAGEFRNIFISNTFDTGFRLVADKPVLAVVDSEGFVPTTAGQTVGKEFYFATTYPSQEGQDSLFILNRHPTLAHTVVRLESLTDDTSQEIHLNGGSNHFLYTLGSHATSPQDGSDGCDFPTSERMAAIPPGVGRYRATVTQGGPVSIQLQPVRGVTQIPGDDQAPTSNAFWSALSRSEAESPNCLPVASQYSLYVTGTEAGHFEITSPESPLPRLFPRCETAPCPDGQAIGPAPARAFARETVDTQDLTDRPFRLTSTVPATLMVAPPPLPNSLASAPLRGPLGGADAGQKYTGFGPTSIYTPFADTVVRAEIHYAASGKVDQTLSLLKGRLSDLPTRTGDPILWYHLDANRPILVLPRGAPPGFLGGIPATLTATVHDADYRGHLVEVQSVTGLDPVSDSTVPGEGVDYTFVVTNRGRGADAADLPDTILVSPSTPPPGWEATLSRTTLPLASDESQTVTMRVTPSVDAKPGDLGSVTLQATSRGNPQVTHSVDTITHIKRSFDVGLWFECAECHKLERNASAAGQPNQFNIVLQNLGSATDTFTLMFTPPGSAWVVELLRDGDPVPDVTLGPRRSDTDTADLVLRVTPPADIAEGILLTEVTAQSTSSPAVLDRVVAIARVHAPSDLNLVAAERVQWVDPGEEAVFPVLLTNGGQGHASVHFDARADDLPAWSDPVVFLISSTTGQRFAVDPATPTTIGPGEALPLGVNITAPANATAGDQVALRFHVEAPNQDQGLEAFLHAFVRTVHDLEVTLPDTPPRILQGNTSATFDLRVTNRGNLNETLTPLAASLPPGWSFEFPDDDILVPRNATQNLAIGVTAPADVAEGSYAVGIRLAAADGNVTMVSLPVHVGSFSDHALTGPDPVDAQPGHDATTYFRFENQGNTFLRVRLEADPAEPWTLIHPDAEQTVPPRGRVTVPVAWEVPRDSPTSTTTHRATLIAEPDVDGVGTIRRTMEAPVAVDRADVTVVDATEFRGAAGTIVDAVITNEGRRTAYDVELRFLVDGDVLDRVVMTEIPPGGLRTATFLQPDALNGTASLIVDPDDRVVESDETNNVFGVDKAGDVLGSAAGAPIALALACLTVAVVIRRRK